MGKQKSKYPPELKLKALGMIHQDLPLREIGEQLEIPYPKLLEWKKELQAGIENKNLADIIDVDAAVVHEAAEHVAEELIKLDPSQSEAIEGELLQVEKGIDGYQVLSERMQKVALKLTNKISAAADDNPGADQIESLVTSLSRLQEAFFNKNITQVAVFGGGDQGSSTGVSKFKGLQKA